MYRLPKIGSITTPTNTIVMLGDSFVFRDAPDNPVSGYTNIVPTSVFGWMNFLLGQRFTVLNYTGITGNKTDAMYNRLGTDVLPYKPDYCWVPITVNDIFNSNLTPYPAATTITNVTNIVQVLLQNGIIPIVSTTPPNSEIITATDVGIWDAVNSWAKSKLPYLFKNKVIVIEGDWAYLNTDSNTGQPNLTYLEPGGVHPNMGGAYRLAEAYAQQLDDKIPVINVPFAHSYHASATTEIAIDANPMNIGTGGSLGSGVSGQVANNYSVNCNNGTNQTAVCAKIARTDAPGYWQQITYNSGTVYGDAFNNVTYGSSTVRPLTGLTPGTSVFQFICEFEMDAAPVGFKLPTVGVQFAGAGATSEYAAAFNPPSGAGNIDKWIPRGIMATPPRVVPATATGLWISMSAFPSANNSNFTIRFGRHCIRKIS